LALTAIFRNEAPYLKEWIEFHREVGFDHFYLFDNLSVDSYLPVLQTYIEHGIVDLFSWPLEHTQQNDWTDIQCLAYEKALQLARDQAKWLAIIDVDEFLFPAKKRSLVEILSQYENFGGIGVNWQVFGTSRVSKIPENRLLIETLHLKLPENDSANRFIKSIVQPKFVLGCTNPHYVVYRPGYFQVNSDSIPFIGSESPYVQIDTIRINHYRLRDEHYLHAQKIPRARKWWNAQPEERWKAYYQSFNQVSDRAISRFIPCVKDRLKASYPDQM